MSPAGKTSPAQNSPSEAGGARPGRDEVTPREGWGETFRTVLYAVLIALVVRTFAFEPFNIPSSSMQPTLKEGDYLFVSKFSYGYSRHSLPFGLPLIPGRIFFDPPERGDVVVFKKPTAPRMDFIKRVVGLPGDRIQVTDGVLHINGEAVAREKLGRRSYRTQVSLGGRRIVVEKTAMAWRETLPGGTSYVALDETPTGDLDDTPVFEVPEGHYFMMGDNRDNSTDSRAIGEVGYVPAANLVGRAETLFFSLEAGTAFWELWRWPFAIRYGRLFDDVG